MSGVMEGRMEGQAEVRDRSRSGAKGSPRHRAASSVCATEPAMTPSSAPSSCLSRTSARYETTALKFAIADAAPSPGARSAARSGTTIDYDRREEIRGPVHRVLKQVVARVDELGTRKYELARLPEVVLSEAIANALAHHSYEAAGTAVRVEIRPSLLVVRSPGGPPELVTVDNIREASADATSS
jgi:hypothetical protein